MADYDIGVTETIEIEDIAFNQLHPILLDVYDESTVSESNDFFLLSINVSDTVSASEYDKIDFWWAQPEAETVTITENLSINTTFNININETVSVSESVSVGFIEIIWIRNIYESVAAAEYIFQFNPDQLFIDKYEEVSVVEFGSGDIFPTPRNATQSWLSAVNAQSNHPVFLIHMDIEDPVYMSTGFCDIVYSGNTFKAANGFIQVSDIVESSEIGIETITLALAGANQVLIYQFLAQEYIDKDCHIWLAFLDADDVLIDDPVKIFAGHIDSPVMTEDENGVVSVAVSVTNQWVDFERKPGRYTNDECQQAWFPGDRGLEFCYQIQKDIDWRE